VTGGTPPGQHYPRTGRADWPGQPPSWRTSLAQRTAEHLIRRACSRLPADMGDERCREWIAELPAILSDPDVDVAFVRSARALRFAAGARRSARHLRRSAGTARGQGRAPANARSTAWASRSRQSAPARPKLPDGVRLLIAAPVIWLVLVVLIHAYPPQGGWNYAVAGAGGACGVLALIGWVRLILWSRRRSGQSPPP
jgi:hypothetical protein